ncbi:MAG: hypothetical protein J5J06_04650 [Phycisphaerae bacterium]|nr:hypothetical protein [Phycisphaerae bacterium]
MATNSSATGERPARRLTGPVRVALAWIGVVLVGAILLRFPGAAAGEPLAWIDALFTSTSALCVTGLTTVTISEQLSTFGQTVVLVLIQMGGLGITTLSTFLLLAAGRATMSHVLAAKDTLAAVRVNPLRLLFWVLFSTVLIEAVGTIFLKWHLGASSTWWNAIFHSVSAFCNAGFSLFPDSLERFQSDVGVNFTITSLIILGGLGFIAIYQLLVWAAMLIRRRRNRLPLHARTVLSANVALWALGILLFMGFEWNGVMYGTSRGTGLLASWFQSVTTRTAGFNTLDFGLMREPTLFFTMFLMLIGGASGGCAGGIKVTTMAVVLASVRARLRGTETVALFRRTIPVAVVRRSFLILILSLIFLTLVVAGLLISEEQRPVGDIRGDRFMLLAFEAVSAFGTVGLSTGITAGLSVSGKLLIIVCMLVGRLGPLAVALAVIRPKKPPLYEFPEEELAIG